MSIIQKLSTYLALFFPLPFQMSSGDKTKRIVFKSQNIPMSAGTPTPERATGCNILRQVCDITPTAVFPLFKHLAYNLP